MCHSAAMSYRQLRRGFARLLDRLEAGDVLVVTKLDRLGRNAMDVGATVAKLDELGVRVHCLALGGVDLTSSTDKLTIAVINAVAEFERDLLIERTQVGLSRARAEGRRLGRPDSLTSEQRAEVARQLGEGASVSALARSFKTSRQTSCGSETRPCRPDRPGIPPSRGIGQQALKKNRHLSLKVTATRSA